MKKRGLSKGRKRKSLQHESPLLKALLKSGISEDQALIILKNWKRYG